MNLVNKIIFLISICSVQAFADGTVFGNLIQEAEFRSRHRFDGRKRGYDNTLRFKIGTLGAGAKNKLLDMEQSSEQVEAAFLRAEINLMESLSSEQINVSKVWAKDLSRAYRAYREYLKSNPSVARNSIDIDVNEILIQLEVFEDAVKVKISIDKALQLKISKESFLRSFEDSKNRKLSLSKQAYRADRNLIKFVELGTSGLYETSEGHSANARISLNIPLGFLGAQVESRKKMALDQYKLKTQAYQKKLEFKKAYSDLELKRKLYLRLQTKLVSRRNVKKMTLSTSIGVDDKVKIYIDAIKMSHKVLSLKYEVAYLHNKIMKSTGASSSFIGLE